MNAIILIYSEFFLQNFKYTPKNVFIHKNMKGIKNCNVIKMNNR